MRRVPDGSSVWPSAAARITPAMMASTTRPSTSSITAAPRMMRALGVRIACASCSTRAVMPTDVAASIAPRKACTIHDSPGSSAMPTPKPSAIGITIPASATFVAGMPTASMSRGVDSRPTSNSSRIAPSSARIANVSLPCSETRLGPPKSARLPSRMPKTSSPRTAGWPTRSTSAPRSFAPTSTKASAARIRPCSPWLAADASSRSVIRASLPNTSARPHRGRKGSGQQPNAADTGC